MGSPDRMLGRRQPARFVEGSEEHVDLCAAFLAPEQGRATFRAKLTDGSLRRSVARRLAAADGQSFTATGRKSGHRSARLALALGAITNVGARGRAHHRVTNRAAQAAARVLLAHPWQHGAWGSRVKRPPLVSRRGGPCFPLPFASRHVRCQCVIRGLLTNSQPRDLTGQDAHHAGSAQRPLLCALLAVRARVGLPSHRVQSGR
jgi:hypothetical protein